MTDLQNIPETQLMILFAYEQTVQNTQLYFTDQEIGCMVNKHDKIPTMLLCLLTNLCFIMADGYVLSKHPMPRQEFHSKVKIPNDVHREVSTGP